MKKTKCIFSKKGMCNSDYRKFRKCNGIKIPDDCPYNYKKVMEIEA